MVSHVSNLKSYQLPIAASTDEGSLDQSPEVWLAGVPARVAKTPRSSAAATAHQTRQAFSRTIGALGAQLKAFWNSGMFETTPFTR